MKLNPDCIRDILLDVEERTGPWQDVTYTFHPVLPCELPEKFSKYKPEEVLYHVDQCNQNGYLSAYEEYISGSVSIGGLTPAGHKFLDAIRPVSRWKEIKSTARKLGIWSLENLGPLALELLAAQIKGGA